jgi:tetratricopeptide (TPR) repeat protein
MGGVHSNSTSVSSLGRILGLAAAVVAVAFVTNPVGAQGSAAANGSLGADGLLAAYLAGDTGVIERSLRTSVDYQKRFKLGEPREFDKWLGEFDHGKAVFVLALAQSSTVVARQFTPMLLRAGGRFVDGVPGRNARPGAQTDFARAWHRAAVSLLLGAQNGPALEEHLSAIASRGRSDVTSDGRLLLARAVAHEMRCWVIRPSLDQPSLQVDALAKAAGVVIAADLDGPTKAGRERMAAAHAACVNEAIARFDAARGEAESRAEASVRGGWLLVQQGRFQEALAWIEAAAPGADAELAYWRSLFLGRALSGLNRHREASDAYRDAFTRFPGAQSAGLGLAFELLWLDRDAEADQIARTLRTTAVNAADPWMTYLLSDGRFAARAVEQVRRRVFP